jgi:hypothetical protein
MGPLLSYGSSAIAISTITPFASAGIRYIFQGMGRSEVSTLDPSSNGIFWRLPFSGSDFPVTQVFG